MVAVSSSGANASATAAVTLDSGVRVSIVPSTYTIGLNETFSFKPKASVTGVPPGAVIPGVCGDNPGDPLCTDFYWGVSSGGGNINGFGNYVAPSSGTTATITAQSVYDTSQTATATIALVTPTDPTLTSISSTVGAAGAVLQDVYLTGSNFISTTQVFFNGNLVSDADPVNLAPTANVLRARLADVNLQTPGTFEFKVLRQGSSVVACSNPCTLTLSAQRPAIVGTNHDSFAQTSGISGPTIVVDGGYYGPSSAPVVSSQFGDQSPASATVENANRLSIATGGADANTQGLVPLTVSGNIPGAPVPPAEAVANVAVQPDYTKAPAPTLLAQLPAGTQPSGVAVNTATGIAVVANQGSHSVTLVDLSGPTVLGFICTAAQGSTLVASDVGCSAEGASAPTSVAVDNLRNLALVTNSGTKSIAVIDLTARKVRETVSVGLPNIAPTPWAVGINPSSGRAVVAYQVAGFASIVDLNQVPAAIIGIVADGTGPTPRVAVSPRLNWGLITPGGLGGLSIVDLGRQNSNAISSAVRLINSNVVTITTLTPHTLRIGDPVLVTGIADNSFNGVFNISGVSGNTFTYSTPSNAAASPSTSGATANYALPIAAVAANVGVIGVGINDETQKAILLDPNTFDPQGIIFNLLDQTSAVVTGLASPGTTAGAFNPFTNVAVTVNRINSNATIVDPTTPGVLTNGTLGGLNAPVDVAFDPGTNEAVIANSGGFPSGTVSIFSLGGIRTPQILQVSRQDSNSPNPQPPELELTSTLSTPATTVDQTLTIIGKGLAGGTVLLDGDSTGVQVQSSSDRMITAKVLAARLSAGSRLYALEVVNGAHTSNAATFTVTQSITGSCAASGPLGVAIDYSNRNLAVVTNPGCNSVDIISLGGSNPTPVGTGTTVSVGTTPQGVGMYLTLGLAVVANQGSNNASIVPVGGGSVVTVNTDPGPTGVAIDEGLGLAVVTASSANTVDTFTISSTPGAPTSVPVQQRPVAVAVDPVAHTAAVANTTSGTVTLVNLIGNTATNQVAAGGLPAGIAFDPVSSSFLAAASLLNEVLVLNTVSQTTIGLRVGINPTSIAYNFVTGTLVTTNGSSQTMSVMDLFSGTVRSVSSFRPSGRFAVAIHPFTNLAVITDSADNKVYLRPLPR
jgi:DNA-binding beta-propeller fold protein YncE